MRDGTRAFSQIHGIFHYFRAFQTEILHIYSLIGQILKQLAPSVSVTSGEYLPRLGKYPPLGCDEPKMPGLDRVNKGNFLIGFHTRTHAFSFL